MKVISFTCLARYALHLVEKRLVSKFSYRKSFEADLKWCSNGG